MKMTEEELRLKIVDLIHEATQSGLDTMAIIGLFEFHLFTLKLSLAELIRKQNEEEHYGPA